MKTARCLSSVLILFSATTAVPVFAVELKPGKWGFSSVTTTMMTTEGVEEYNEQCMVEPFDPMGEMMQGGMESACEVKVNSETATSFDADLSCNAPNGTISGHFTVDVTSNGNHAEGEIEMSMEIGGQTMNVLSATYEAEYLGSCE